MKRLSLLTEAPKNGASLVIADDLLEEVGWRRGDTIEVKVLGHMLKLRRVVKRDGIIDE